MIDHISIRNFAIIENTDVDLNDGLNIITGETGSGKSILIEAVSLALGSRADSSCVRTGTDKAVVELSGDLDGKDIVIRREVSRTGKNLIKVNGDMVTLAELNRITRRMADIHGQYDNQSLLDPEFHIVLLDSYRADLIKGLKENTAALYHKYSSVKSELIKLLNHEKQSKRDLDFHKFEADEIDSACLVPGEDESLDKKIDLLKNSERIYEELETVYSALSSDGAALDSLNAGLSAMEDLKRFSSGLSDASSEYTDIYYRLQDLSREVVRIRDSVSFSQEELDEAISRKSTIDNLKKKYASSIDEILDYRADLEEKIRVIENFDTEKADLEKELLSVRRELIEACNSLTAARKDAAVELSEKTLRELNDLNFKDAAIEISVTPLPQPQEDGMDKVEILISTNKGEPLKPLYKVASGGEISRIMLAFKNVISSYDSIPTLIFDEIDNGISGYTASVVASKLKEIAKDHQIICITHLPQIAAAGDHNYRIYKESDDASTFTHLEYLDSETKVGEIARLIGGATITENTLISARELIEGRK
jgi:DNA repair protein RecN (Recombination protein N)